MDLGPEKVHADLTEVGLPSSIADLTNPTEDYILTLLTQFVIKFHIDLSTIKRVRETKKYRINERFDLYFVNQ